MYVLRAPKGAHFFMKKFDIKNNYYKVKEYNVESLHIQLAVQHQEKLLMQFMQENNVPNVLKCIEKLVALDPNHNDAWYYKALIHEKLGELDLAKQSLEINIKNNNKDFRALVALGNLLVNEDAKKARELYQKALEIKNDVLIAMNLAEADIKLAEFRSAKNVLKGFLETDSENDMLHSNLSVIYLNLLDIDKAVEHARLALKRNVNNSLATYNLAKSYSMLGDYDSALELLKTNNTENKELILKADLLGKKGRWLEAIDLLSKEEWIFDAEYSSVAILQMVEMNYYLSRKEKCEEWIDIYEQKFGSDVNSRWLRWLNIIPKKLFSIENATDEREDFLYNADYIYDWVQKNKIDLLDLLDESPLYHYAYHGIKDKELVKAYGDVATLIVSNYLQGIKRTPKPLANANKKIRIGVVSSHFYESATWTAITESLYKNKPEDFEIYSYDVGLRKDKFTHYVSNVSKKYVQGVYEIEKLIDIIVDDALDFIFYPEIGLDSLTYQLATQKLAPIQITSWGWPITSGLKSIDFYISSEAMEPKNSRKNYTEELILLPGLGTEYRESAIKDEPFDIEERYGVRGDIVLCPGTSYKYQPYYVDLYRDILKENPSITMLFFSYKQDWMTDFVGELVKGVDGDNRAMILPWLSAGEYQYLMKKSMLMLDTIGFSGFNTVAKALESDLPIVTLRGELLRGNFGAGILDYLGLSCYVASDFEDYKEKIKKTINNLDYRSLFVESIKEKKGGLFRENNSTNEFYSFLKGF